MINHTSSTYFLRAKPDLLSINPSSSLSYILLESLFMLNFTNLHFCLDGTMGSGGIMVLALTLHIYPDGLDGSNPNPVLGLAVITASLHPLDVVDAQRFIEDRRVLEFV